MNIKPYFIFILLFLSLTGCVKYPEIISIEKFDIQDLKDSVLTAKVTVNIKNPNFYDAKIVGVDSKMYIENNLVGKSMSKEKMILKADKTTQVSFLTHFDLVEMKKVYPILLSKKETKIKIVGDYTIDVPIKNVKVSATSYANIDFQAYIRKEVDRQFQERTFRIKSVTPKSVGMTETELEIRASITNKFPFSYQLQTLKVKFVEQDGIEALGHWELDKPETIQAKAEKEMLIKVTISNQNALKQVTDMFFGKKQVVFMEGNAIVTLANQTFKIPIKQKVM